MRNLAARAMALPSIAHAHLEALARTPLVIRAGIGVVLALVVGAGAIAISGATSTTATRPSAPVHLTKAAFTSVVTTGRLLDEPMVVRFNTPMNRDSVAAALRIRPARDVELKWDTQSRTLTIDPVGAWIPDALHTVTVEPGALAENGRPLATPARAAFLTRPRSTGRIEPSRPRGDRVAIDTSFTITFSRPVATASVAGGLRAKPAMDGTLVPTKWQPDGTSFTFTPRAALPTKTPFTLSLSGVRTVDGEVLAPMSLSVQTVSAPRVVRLRPRAGADGIERTSKISIRFSQSMDRTTTADALKVTVNGKAIKGKITFKDEGKALTFTPKKALPYRAKVKVTVADTATSIIGTPLNETTTVRYRVERRPPPPSQRAGSSGGATAIGSGGSGGGGSWAGVERYYLGLMNCTRTGGWVTSSGSCSSPGGRNVAPLRLDAGISSRVARPYARLLATTGQCSHYADGGPSDRLRRAGYTSSRWGENIGCRSGDPYAAVLATHLFFQSERSYNGGHYRNLMDSRFSRAGIGVWVSGGRVRLVIDFYHP